MIFLAIYSLGVLEVTGMGLTALYISPLCTYSKFEIGTKLGQVIVCVLNVLTHVPLYSRSHISTLDIDWLVQQQPRSNA